MQTFPLQRNSILNCSGRLNIWDGPVRSGKSVASVLAWLEFVGFSGPRTGDFFMIGKTVGALKRNIISPMQDMVGPDCVYHSSEPLIRMWGRTLHVVGANDQKSEAKVRGSTSAGTYGDEMVLWAKNFLPMATSRMSIHGAKFMGTTNPDSPNHWLKKDYLDRADEINLKRFHWGLRENTFLDPEYILQIEAEYTGLWKKRFIDGLWVLAQGAIYDMFRETEENQPGHTHLDFPEPDEYIVGVDYGTTNPCVFVLMGIKYDTPKGVIAWAEREYYWDSQKKMRQKTDSQYADDMVVFLGKRSHPHKHVATLYVDPSAASFKLELEGRGLPVEDADNDVSNGIRTQARMIHQGRYSLNALECPMTIAEYPGYVWNQKRSESGVEEPVKVDDHGKDAERYPLHSKFGGDSILYTPQGLKW